MGGGNVVEIQGRRGWREDMKVETAWLEMCVAFQSVFNSSEGFRSHFSSP